MVDMARSTGRRHEVGGVEGLGSMVTVVVTIDDVRSHVVTNVTIEHGAHGGAGAGLLHPVGDIQEVRVVIRVRGVIGSSGQCSCLVTVTGPSSPISILVISAMNNNVS